jgi:hypothetical protein
MYTLHLPEKQIGYARKSSKRNALAEFRGHWIENTFTFYWFSLESSKA